MHYVYARQKYKDMCVCVCVCKLDCEKKTLGLQSLRPDQVKGDILSRNVFKFVSHTHMHTHHICQQIQICIKAVGVDVWIE